MKPLPSMQALSTAMAALVLSFILFSLLLLFWLFPILRMKLRLKRCGFDGPPPMFPLGNLKEMKKEGKGTGPPCPATLTQDIHSQVFPYFALWRKTYGKIFVYWLGTEPFLYVADPEFLKQVTWGALCKKWGKPEVFKHDRKPMFGNGLVMAEGDEWADHRHIIAQAFSMTNLNGRMISIMVETTSKMLDNWNHHLSTNRREIDVERDITGNAAEIIAKASFGISDQNGKLVFDKLRALQAKLFRPNRLVGVPFSNLLYPKHTHDVRKLGEEIDRLLLSIIESRMTGGGGSEGTVHLDLLAILLDSNKFTSRELVDECKTFFFGGLETTALALTWALFLLATYPEWQEILRKEVMQVTGGQPLESTMLSKLTKMEMVLNEVLRLYSPAPNAQRQAREDIRVEDAVIIPKGTNMWIDVVGMHRDPALWGDDVHEFRPDRFEGSLCGVCRHRMGFLPFGFGDRVCVGRNLTLMEYKVVLSLILRRS